MKLTIPPKELLSALKAGIHGRSTLMISEYVLIQAGGAGTIRFTTFNDSREYWIEVENDNIEGDGAAVVSVGGLSSIITAGSADCVLETTAHGLLVEQGKASFTIPMLQEKDFPTVGVDETEQLPVDPLELKAGIGAVKTTAQPQGAKIFQQVIHVGDNHAVAFGGNLLSAAAIEYNGTPFHIHVRDSDLVTRTLSEASQVFAGKADGVNKNLIINNGPDQLKIPFQFLEFPAWNSNLPKEEGSYFDVDADQLAIAVRRCCAASNLKHLNKYACIAIEPHQDSLDVISVTNLVPSPETGIDNVTVEAGVYTLGEKPPIVGFNVALLTDVLSHFKDQKIRWRPFLEHQPAIHLFSRLDGSCRHFLAPVVLNFGKTGK